MQPPLRRTSPCTLTVPSLILCPHSVSSSCSSCSSSCLLFPSLLLSLQTLPTRLAVLCPLLQRFAHPALAMHSVRSLIPAGTMPTTRATGTTSFRPRPPLRSLPLCVPYRSRPLRPGTRIPQQHPSAMYHSHPSPQQHPSPIHFPQHLHPRHHLTRRIHPHF